MKILILKHKKQDISYYINNKLILPDRLADATELVGAIRNHWGIESGNWIRDITFGEDNVRTKVGNQAQILASLRTLATTLLRMDNAKNFQATIEKFNDIPSILESFLKKVKFL